MCRDTYVHQCFEHSNVSTDVVDTILFGEVSGTVGRMFDIDVSTLSIDGAQSRGRVWRVQVSRPDTALRWQDCSS